MSLKNVLKGGMSTFAHFAGRRTAKKADEDSEGEDMRQAETEECEEGAAASGAAAEDAPGDEGDENKDKKKTKTKTAAAANDDDGDDDGDDGDDSDDEDDNDDDQDEDKPKDAKGAKGKAGFANGRKAERTRCAQIFGHTAAARNVQLACKLAFTTNMSAKAAIGILESAPAARGGLADRMERTNITRTPVGGASELKGDAAISKSWEMAFADFVPKA